MTEHRIGLVVATLGREHVLRDLLESLNASELLPAAVVVADQSGRTLDLGPPRRFPVTVVASAGGASRGRNSGLAALPPGLDYVGFPNDHSRYRADTLAALHAAAVAHDAPEAIVGLLDEDHGVRFSLPPEGTVLDRRSVWRAIEPATFVAVRALPRPAFDEDLGTGAGTPWQSGEGTDLLLRVLAAGGRVVSCPSVRVRGRGERRDLSGPEYRTKLRAYARGTGYVYRQHRYPSWQQARLVLAPWARWVQSRDWSPEAARAALQTSLGRWEGVTGRLLTPVDYRPR